MTNRKISEFTASTGLPSDTFLTLVTGGKNTKIALADFLAALNVTGSIVQDGAVTGTPVLDIAGSINNIRNIEDGPGIKSSVSAENGLTLEHNFTQDATGVALQDSLTADITNWRSLVAGAGITISSPSAGQIQIAAPGVVTASNVVIVNQMSDFPAAAAGVRTLADNTGYLISAFLTTSDRFVMGSNTVVFGSDRFVSGITYTGIGAMFTATDVSSHIKDVTLDAATGSVFDVSSTPTGKLFLFDNLTVTSCDTLGTISGMTGVRLSNITLSDVKTDGITFSGANSVFLMNGALSTVNGGALLDLGSATFDSVSCLSSFTTLAGGAFFMSGLVSSGNINTGGLGAITNSRFFGAGTPLQNITVDDALWQFAENDDIPDTRPDALLSLTVADTVVISAANTPVKIDGPWNSERASQMTAATNGTITFNGGKDATLPMLASLSAEPSTGTNKDITFYIAINGSIVTNSGAKTTVSSGGPKNTPIPWQSILNPTDTVEVWVENNTDTTNIQINSGILRVN